MDSKIDLIFQKEPGQVQQKLMQLLLHYNASLQYNSKEDKFQVDLLLPFQNYQQKSEFLSEFYRSRTSNYQHSNRHQSDHQLQNQSRRHSISNSENIGNNKLENINERERILQQFTKKNQSLFNQIYQQTHHKQNGLPGQQQKLAVKQHTSEAKQQVRDKDSASASTKLGQIHVNFEKISKVLDQNLLRAIYSIKEERKKQDSSISSNKKKQQKQSKTSSNLNISSAMKQPCVQEEGINDQRNKQQIKVFQKKPHRLEQIIVHKQREISFEQNSMTMINKSPIDDLKIKTNQLFIQQDASEDKRQVQSLSEVQSQGKINSFQPRQQERAFAYNSPPSRRYQDNNNGYGSQSQNNSNGAQILIEDELGFSQQYSQNQASLGTTIGSNNNQNFSSFVIGKIIQQNMEHQEQSEKSLDFNQKSESQIEFDRQIELFPRSHKSNEFSPSSYVQKYKKYKQQHQNFLHDKYAKRFGTAGQSQRKQIKQKSHTSKRPNSKRDQISSNIGMRKSYNEFLRSNEQNLQRVYEQIQKDIKRNKGKRFASHFQSSRSSQYSDEGQNRGILIQQDDYLDDQRDQTQEQAAFKTEIMKQYTDKIVVNNESMSSEDLIRYFRYLLRNARSLYAKHIRRESQKIQPNFAREKIFAKPYK